MPTRRDALKTLALGAGALIASGASNALAAADKMAKPVATPPNATPPANAGPYTLPPLPYAVDALEPYIDAQTMTIHHDKHHAAYVANLNKALVGHAELGKQSIDDLMRALDTVPADIRAAVRNQGGGHANHSQFWLSLSAKGAKAPVGEFAGAIDKAFGSFAGFHEQWAKAAGGVFGSGWAWLTLDPKQSLMLETSANQDTPLSAGRTPLLGIDVWEHAYYLKYQNRRADYIAAFANVIDWDRVSQRYAEAMKG